MNAFEWVMFGLIAVVVFAVLMVRTGREAAPALIVHKRNSQGKVVCGRDRLTDEESSVSYWSDVTCPRCRALMPRDAVERTTIKRSHRAEGVNFVD